MSDRFVFTSLLLLALLAGIAGSLGAPLVPLIAAEEEVSLGLAQWSLTGSLLVAAVAAPVVGRLGVGRRRKPVLLATLALATVGALVCALPTGITGILVGRCLQGFAYAVTPLVFSVARDVITEEKLSSSLSTLSVANVVAAGIGFPLVAFVAEHLGLHGAFWFGFASMVAAVVLGALVTPSSREPVTSRVDVVGAMLLGGGTLALLLVVSRGGDWGYTSGVSLLLAAGGTALLGVSLAWFQRVGDPLIDLRLARVPAVLGAHVAAVLAGTGMYVLLSVVMVIAQSPPDRGYGLGRSVAFAGLMLTPYAVLSVVGNRLALRAGRRIGPEQILPIGCLVYAASLLFLWRWHLEPWQLATAMCLGGLASGMTFNAIPWLVVRVIPASETGSVLGVNIVLRFGGFALGSALALALLEGFGGASNQPTKTGFDAAVLVGAAICVLGAVVSARLLRRPPVRPA